MLRLNKKIIKSIAIDPNLWEEAKKITNKFKISMSSLISMALVEKINKMQGE